MSSREERRFQNRIFADSSECGEHVPAGGVDCELVDAEDDAVGLEEAVDDDHDDNGDDEEVDDEVDDGGAALSYPLSQLVLQSQETALSRVEEDRGLRGRVTLHSGHEAPSEKR